MFQDFDLAPRDLPEMNTKEENMPVFVGREKLKKKFFFVLVPLRLTCTGKMFCVQAVRASFVKQFVALHERFLIFNIDHGNSNQSIHLMATTLCKAFFCEHPFLYALQ